MLSYNLTLNQPETEISVFAVRQCRLPLFSGNGRPLNAIVLASVAEIIVFVHLEALLVSLLLSPPRSRCQE